MKTIKSHLKTWINFNLISSFTIDCKPTWRANREHKWTHINTPTIDIKNNIIINNVILIMFFPLPLSLHFKSSHTSHKSSQTSHTSHAKRNQYIIILSFNFKMMFIKMFRTKTNSIHYHPFIQLQMMFIKMFHTNKINTLSSFVAFPREHNQNDIVNDDIIFDVNGWCIDVCSFVFSITLFMLS